ncbi:MAG: hypothetical protein KDA32_06150 [Phycisphaerales bacterium]|nr:hypothetical protein [Phycisphaerales bacterium]
MLIEPKQPPRAFRVGVDRRIEISDCGDIHLAPDEQVTFVTPDGKRHDFAAKEWGFYATPSVNGRLAHEGFRTALVRNEQRRYYVMVVNQARLNAFEAYLREERQTLVEWLDERD